MDRELGYSFHRLVAERGWLAFREVEYAIVKRIAAMPGVVAALGGGTVRYAWNVDALRGTGAIVLLEADLPTLAARVRAADRPRVNPGTSLDEDLAAIWSSSEHLYRAAATLTYRTDALRTPEDDAAALAALVAPFL
jgi:shikimate kinase